MPGPGFAPPDLCSIHTLPPSRKSLLKQSAAGSAPVGARWAMMTRPRR